MKRINEKTAFKVLVVLAMIFLITIFHYITNQEELVLHVIYRELYFLPIILAGFWFGLRGGLSTAIIVTVLYLPVVIGKPNGISGHDLGNLLEILLFNIIGILVGWLKNREIMHQELRIKEEGLAVIGKAVACVIHDLKTPIVTIGGLARQISRKIPMEDESSSKLNMVLLETERLELMVNDMLAFAKPLELNCKNYDITKFFQETMHIAGEKARKHNVKLSFQFQDEISVYSFDYYRLQQALLNLINNAVEASPDEGEVVIRSKLVSDNILIEVDDYGEGISPEKFDEILHPFFSIKKEGTGLGLPIVQKIAEAHGGTLQYKQQSEKGMIFKLMIPVET